MKVKVFNFVLFPDTIYKEDIERDVNEFLASEECWKVVKYTTNTITSKVYDRRPVEEEHKGLLIITILYQTKPTNDV